MYALRLSVTTRNPVIGWTDNWHFVRSAKLFVFRPLTVSVCSFIRVYKHVLYYIFIILRFVYTRPGNVCRNDKRCSLNSLTCSFFFSPVRESPACACTIAVSRHNTGIPRVVYNRYRVVAHTYTDYIRRVF